MLYPLYIASVVGAIALVLMMPRAGFNPRKIGALLGAATLGGLWLVLSRQLPQDLGISSAAWIYYYIFSAIAIAAAVRVITHTRPVYSALWFVLVVCATAGLFLILSAEFMAFAMIIIYGGAILVTYVFVIMLASQSGAAGDDAGEPAYDRIAVEPVAAIAAGFLLLAVLLSVMFAPGNITPPDAAAIARREQTIHNEIFAPGRVPSADADAAEDANLQLLARRDARGGAYDNVAYVGLDLFQSHPLGLELAGVILLVSLVGAVVIARKHVEEPANMGPAGSGPYDSKPLDSTSSSASDVGPGTGGLA
jgi:NADH-quinone oxidoreductase subunit J